MIIYINEMYLDSHSFRNAIIIVIVLLQFYHSLGYSKLLTDFSQRQAHKKPIIVSLNSEVSFLALPSVFSSLLPLLRTKCSLDYLLIDSKVPQTNESRAIYALLFTVLPSVLS